MTNNKSVQKKGRWARKRERERSSKKKESYRKIARLRLQEQFSNGIGRDRAKDKREGISHKFIYSKTSFLTYKQQSQQFAKWLEKEHGESVTIDEARSYVDDYLRYLMKIGRSASTLATVKSALAKVFKCSSREFVKTPSRTRASIKRSRQEAKRDKHISQKTEEKYAMYTSALGLRRFEMLNLRSKDLFFKDGRAYIHVVRGKNGKSRNVMICGKTEEETRAIVKYIASKKGQVFPTLPSHYDNHYYRAVHAMRVYKLFARDTDKIPRKEKYIMRKDRAGEVLDRVAMKQASRALGHERIQVIAQSYLYEL